jgi:ribosome-binding factor A
VSERTRRIDHLLQEEISAIVQRELEDPRVGFVTITSVETTPDLHHATVYASIIGDEAERKATMAALGRAMPFVRHRLGRLHLRRIPELHLREDDSVQRGTRVLKLLEQVEAELAGDGPVEEAPSESPPLPSPATLREMGRVEGDPAGAPEAPLPPGYRRRVDRVSLRKARKRRGR